jgi:hypothetical protein
MDESPGKDHRAMNSNTDKEIERLILKIQRASRIPRLERSVQSTVLQRYYLTAKRLEPQIHHER